MRGSCERTVCGGLVNRLASVKLDERGRLQNYLNKNRLEEEEMKERRRKRHHMKDCGRSAESVTAEEREMLSLMLERPERYR